MELGTTVYVRKNYSINGSECKATIIDIDTKSESEVQYLIRYHNHNYEEWLPITAFLGY